MLACVEGSEAKGWAFGTLVVDALGGKVAAGDQMFYSINTV